MKVSELIVHLQHCLKEFGNEQVIKLEIEHCGGKRSAQLLADVLSCSNGDLLLVSQESTDADPLLSLPVMSNLELVKK